MSAPVLVTGAAGFIGFHVARRLLRDGHPVVGFDNVNAYYDVRLKEARLALLRGTPGFTFVRGELTDERAVDAVVRDRGVERVVHLAAQAGVRHSLTDPGAYTASNVTGFLHVLEACRHARIAHLVYASTSSVYGLDGAMPFSVHQGADHPVSLYAATKKANELMAHSYAHLFGVPSTGLRFFTVYGPWGRPDMALFKFTEAILAGRPIDVYNEGRMQRDFTYIDDIVEGVVRVLDRPPAGNPAWDAAEPDPATSPAPYRLLNIGGSAPVPLLDFIGALEAALGRRAEKNLLPLQPGDVVATAADVSDLTEIVGFTPATPLERGIAEFTRWYLEFYGAGVTEPGTAPAPASATPARAR
jgi:UDP-glucuronate 4-epimerase